MERYLDEAHLAHSLLVVVVHLADQRVAEMHSDPLDGLVLPGRFQDLQQQLVDPAVLELQLLRDAEVTERQAAVPLDLQQKDGSAPWPRPQALAPPPLTHGDLLVLLHPVQNHLDDVAAQADALVAAVLGVGQVEERRAARHLDALIVLMALQGGDHQLHTGRGNT